MNAGEPGLRIVVRTEPSASSMRTTTSVMVATRPSTAIVPPMTPCAHNSVQRSTIEPGTICVETGDTG